MEFAEKLDQYMRQHHISNKEIEEHTNIANSLVGYWRKGVRKPTLNNLVKLSDYLGVPIDYLTCRMDDEELELLLSYRNKTSK